MPFTFFFTKKKVKYSNDKKYYSFKKRQHILRKKNQTLFPLKFYIFIENIANSSYSTLNLIKTV